ncbi:MAG: DUF1800 domain-containing protein [Planctomycetota bacterium]
MVSNSFTRSLPENLQPWEPSDGDPFDAVKAGHLLNRATFGGTPDEIALVQKLGVSGAVDLLLDFPDASASEMSRTDVPDDSALADVPRTRQERRQAMSQVGRGVGEEARTQRQLLRQQWTRSSLQHIVACQAWWLRRMVDGPYPLQEKLTLFWAGHFTSSIRDDREGSWRLWNQNETLRKFAAGNFIELVSQMSRDPAMLGYLNNDQNVASSPNENYARELMELFTLGVGNYTENDIKEVARCFTGWTHDGVEFVFYDVRHDNGIKTVFGRSGRFGGDEVIRLLAMHPACAPYIAGRLWHYFVGAEPDAQLKTILGSVLSGANFELRPLLRVILRSRAFYSSDHIGNKIKSPVQLVAGSYRLFGSDLPGPRQVTRDLEKLGQIPFAPPNVKGWPGQYDGKRWINTATLLARYNLASNIAAQSRPTPSSEDPSEVVAYWLGRLIPRPIESIKTRRLTNAVGSPPSTSGTLDAVKLIVSMPEYQLC